MPLLTYAGQPNSEKIEYFSEHLSRHHLTLVKIKSKKISRSKSLYLDDVIDLACEGSLDDFLQFSYDVSQDGWKLGSKGHIKAQQHVIYFDIEFLRLHGGKTVDEPNQSQTSKR